MPNYFENVDSEWFSQRLTRVLIVVLLAFAALTARLIYLQAIAGKDFRKQSQINSIRLQDVDAPRGLILDRNMNALVDNRPSFDLYITLKDAKPLEQTLQKLAALLQESPDPMAARINNSKKRGIYAPILIKPDISRDSLAAVEVHRFALPGVEVHVTPRRHYIYENHASHLLGYMGEINTAELQSKTYEDCKSGDVIGKFGTEKAFESALRGKRGGRQVQVNAAGQVERVLSIVDARRGHDLVLTLDHPLQKKTEEMLADRAGAAVALEPDTGRVLALVSSPAFDPNQFVSGISHDNWNALINNPYRPLENKAVQAEYPPASTYKIVTAIAGLEEKVIDAKTTYHCPGYYYFAKRSYRCWKRGGHGEVDVVKALSQSCDVYFYKVGESLGVDRLAKYAHALGLGSPTQIGLDRESRGLIPTSAWKLKRYGVPWQKGETLSIAIGQGFNLVTPLQMAVLTAAIGNGGTRYKPYLVEKAFDNDGNTTFQAYPEAVATMALQPETAALVKKGLWDVVNYPRGTAYQARSKEIFYSGKTGTAQVVGRGDENAPNKLAPKDHAWFVAYAPSENPKIAIAIIVEHGEHGSSAAAPIAGEMIKTYLGLETLVPPASDATTDADNSGGTVTPSGPAGEGQ